MTEKDYDELICAVKQSTKEQEVVIGSSRFFGGGEKLTYKTIKYVDAGLFFAELEKLREEALWQ